MGPRTGLAILVFALALGPARAQHPPDPEQTALIEQTRRAAIAYSGTLPDFICTQVVQRSEDLNGNNRWRPLDVLTIKLSYSGHKEDYKLVAVNGRQTVLDYENAGGAISTGEFGSRLLSMFAPQTRTEFQWKGWAHVSKHKVAVFTYHVDEEHSRYMVVLGPVKIGPNAHMAAYHGEISIDPETHAVMRLTLTAELPKHFPITENNSWTEYDYREVGGQEYLVPVRSHTSLAAGRYRAANEIEFRDYRKFQTDASISFSTEEAPKESPVKK